MIRRISSVDTRSRAVLGCFLDSRGRQRLHAALDPRVALYVAYTHDELTQTLDRRSHEIGTVVIGFQEQAFGNTVRAISAVADRCPHIGIVVHGDHGARPVIRAVALAGAHAFIFRDVNDYGLSLREQLEVATTEAARRATFQMLKPVVPAGLHVFARRCLTELDETTTVTSIARALKVSRQTLYNQCVAHGFCGPEELRAWCRMLLVAHLLCWTTWTQEQVAHALGFPSVTALRNTVKRHAGETASELRRGFGPARVLAAFEGRLTEPERRVKFR